MFKVALLYVCQIAMEEQTLLTYLKKGWEGHITMTTQGGVGRTPLKRWEQCCVSWCLIPNAHAKKNAAVCS